MPGRDKLGLSRKKEFITTLHQQEKHGWGFIEDFDYTVDALNPKLIPAHLN